MSRRVRGVLAAASAVLVSWVAASQPRSSSELTVAAAGDPRVLWNTYLGGTGTDVLHDIERNDAGDVFIVGTVDNAAVFPEGSTTIGTTSGSSVLVVSFHADGGFAWAAHMGGGDRDEGKALVLGPAGEVYVAGTTWSADFPGAPATPLPDGGTPGDAADGFLVKLSPKDQSLEWSLRFGGSGHDEIHDMILGANGRLYVAGETTSDDLPRAAPSTAQGTEAFASSFDLSTVPADVSWTHLFAGVGDQVAYGIAAVVSASSELVYITGRAPNGGQGDDAFVAGFFASNGNPYGTLYLGGSGNDEGRAIVAMKNGTSGEPSATPPLVVVGTSRSPMFLDAGTLGGTSDVFVAAVNAGLLAAPSVRRSMLLGGSDRDEGLAVAVGGPDDGDIYVGGTTRSTNLPLDGGFDSSLGGTGEGFVTRVRLEADPPEQWSSYVGGGLDDSVQALNVDTGSSLLIGGSTFSTDLRYVNEGHALEKTKGSFSDMFLLSVGPQAPPSGADGGDGGEQPGADGGDGGEQPGADGGDGGEQPGTDGGDGGEQPDAGTPELHSPLGWSCGASGGQGGPGALALVTLVGLGLLVSRRRKDASSRA
ncbi:MYXO-CTERM sorting domain-containing protein [Archangium sp.]|uniref:MYXO-CTERM sorting domain-containing protein n=1 Tax=Archangium sp. TaxID=1872627 RepID=UPI00389AB733